MLLREYVVKHPQQCGCFSAFISSRAKCLYCPNACDKLGIIFDCTQN